MAATLLHTIRPRSSLNYRPPGAANARALNAMVSILLVQTISQVTPQSGYVSGDGHNKVQSITLDTWYAANVKLKTSSVLNLILDGTPIQTDAAWQEAAANLGLLRPQQFSKHPNEIYVSYIRCRP